MFYNLIGFSDIFLWKYKNIKGKHKKIQEGAGGEGRGWWGGGGAPPCIFLCFPLIFLYFPRKMSENPVKLIKNVIFFLI